MNHHILPTCRIHRGSALLTGLLALGLAACGSRKDEDRDPAPEASHGSGPARVSMHVPGGSEDQVATSDRCQVVLRQTQDFTEKGVTATFVGAVDTGCAGDDKQPVLYIRMGGAKFSPPVALDCQPKPKGEWNIRCLNASKVINAANGEVKIVIEADANYRGSQVAIMVTYEKP